MARQGLQSVAWGGCRPVAPRLAGGLPPRSVSQALLLRGTFPTRVGAQNGVGARLRESQDAGAVTVGGR